uniref:Uncharacterized protein n=1 Tax=Vitis vinifera TaxID=29760 RepID=F6HZV4_VITVI
MKNSRKLWELRHSASSLIRYENGCEKVLNFTYDGTLMCHLYGLYMIQDGWHLYKCRATLASIGLPIHH